MAERTEVARQFAEIFEQWNDYEEGEKRRLLKNREKRAENKKKDLGMQ